MPFLAGRDLALSFLFAIAPDFPIHLFGICRSSEGAATDLVDKRRLLEELAERLGIEVRYEALGRHRGATSGGRCRLHEQTLIIVDANAPAVEQVGVLLDALSQLNVESLFVPPALRRELRRRRRR